jgi:hypothetical protein
LDKLIATAKGGSDTVKFKTYSANFLMAWLIIFISVFLTTELSAYDGDVDYSAPYITVDPETGKLVTIDPKAQQAQQQQHAATDPNATQDDTGTQDSQLMAQSAPGNAMGQSQEEQATSSANTPMIIGIVILGLAAVVVISTRRNKTANDIENNSVTERESS